VTGRLTSRNSQQPEPSVLLAAEEPQLRRLGDLIDGNAGNSRGARIHAEVVLG